MSLEVLSITGLTLSYHGVRVLQDINFSVRSGDYIGVVGPNGSGKSSLIRCLLGLVEPEQGSISLFSTPLRQFNQWHRVGYLPQALQLFNPSFPATVTEVVKLGLLAGKRPPRRYTRDDSLSVDRALELMGIGDQRHRLIGELSGGLRQRALLARALVSNPDLLILDEPTTALDPETRESFYDVLNQLNRTHGTAILLVTHDTGTIGTVASQLLYLDKKIIFYGGFAEFCASEEMTAFFGHESQHTICRCH